MSIINRSPYPYGERLYIDPHRPWDGHCSQDENPGVASRHWSGLTSPRSRHIDLSSSHWRRLTWPKIIRLNWRHLDVTLPGLEESDVTSSCPWGKLSHWQFPRAETLCSYWTDVSLSFHWSNDPGERVLRVSLSPVLMRRCIDHPSYAAKRLPYLLFVSE